MTLMKTVKCCKYDTYIGSASMGRIQDNIVIVGPPDSAVKESRDRVLTALINSDFSFTFGRTTINLAPADVKKDGPSFTPGSQGQDSSLSPLTRWNSRTLLVTSVSPSATACPAMSKS